MGLDIKEMRNYIINAYPGKVWSDKVKCMPTNQVVAIYYSIMKRANNKDTKSTKTKTEKETEYHQLSLDELFDLSPRKTT